MKDAIRVIVNALHALSFSGILIAGVIGAVYELIGHAKFQAWLASMGISNGFKLYWTISLILLVVLIVTSFIKARFGG